MSLLMKALEKAAKDRGEAAAGPVVPPKPPAAAGVRIDPELTLEPIVVEPDQPVLQGVPKSIAREKSAAAAPSPGIARDSVKAARIISAGAGAEPRPSVVAYFRDRPLVMFGIVAIFFMVGFGGYVYMQMNPGMFTAQAPRPAPIVQTQAPVAATAAAPASPVPGTTSNAPVPATPVRLTSLLPPAEPALIREKLAATTSAVAATAPTPAVPAPRATPAVAATAAPRETIKITTGTTTPAINPVLSEAYSALSAGNLDTSQKLYSQLLKSDARNVDALLGLAAIASQQGDRDTSTRHYIKVIELDPRNSLAQAGLIGIVGSADPQSAETRVKQLIARDPSSAFLFFTLGNTYVDQQRWPDAQQAFFQAHHLQPDNPDYAYNLAVALEHIGQTKSALDFYRRAVSLAAAKGHANFNAAAAQDRVNKLDKVVQ
jgi:Tfp pilus assembly protein PilF